MAAATTEVLSAPFPGSTPKLREYTDEQKSLINQLREYASTLLLPESDPYHWNERRWIEEPECAGRYMRAAKWKLDDGKRRIKGTIEWRRQYKPDLISPDEVEVENESGKIILNGFDNEGRPIITMRPGRQNTSTSPRQILHLIFCLERAIDYMPPGQDSMVILVDYKTASLRSNPSISTASKVLTILQQHYVERLGRAIVTNLPGLLNFFYKGIQPFLDPVTRDKMRFNPNLPELIPVQHLETEFGGAFNYKFDHKNYWAQLLKHSEIAPDGSRYGSHDARTHYLTQIPHSPAASTDSTPPELMHDETDTASNSSRAPSLHLTTSARPSEAADAHKSSPVIFETEPTISHPQTA